MGAESNILGRGALCIALTGQADHAAGESIGHIQNPEGVSIIITDAVVYCITNSTGAANITVGYAATVTAGHNTATIVAAAALAAAAGTAIQGYDHADAGDTMVVVPADYYIVATTSASSAGFTGYLFLNYIRVPE
jgi:hypothetical protein